MLKRFEKKVKAMLTRYGQSMIILEYNHNLDKVSIDFICDKKKKAKWN